MLAADSPTRTSPPVARYTVRRQPPSGVARLPGSSRSEVRVSAVCRCTGTSVAGIAEAGIAEARIEGPPVTPGAAAGDTSGAASSACVVGARSDGGTVTISAADG
jgi:hypothetical protein